MLEDVAWQSALPATVPTHLLQVLHLHGMEDLAEEDLCCGTVLLAV